MWKWKDIEQYVDRFPKSNPLIDADEDIEKLQTHKLRQHRKENSDSTLSEYPSTYSICSGHDDGIIYTGTSHGGTYCWDISRSITIGSYSIANITTPIKSVKYLPRKQLLISGSLNGEVTLWDVRSGKSVRSIKAVEPLSKEADTKMELFCIDIDEHENWLLCGGSELQQGFRSQVSGYVSVFNLSSRSIKNVMISDFGVQTMLLQDMHDIYLGGSQWHIRKRNYMSGKLLHTIQSTIPSILTLRSHIETGAIIAAGCSPYINVYRTSGIHGISLKTHIF